MKILFFYLLSLLPLVAQITYKGESNAENKKHIVFVASDHEYRAEESCTALARILAKHHGYDCTVLYGVNEKGEITAGASNIKGLEALAKADLMVIFTRFLDLPDEQMQHIDAYIKRGGPVVGMRTSSHAFKIKPGKKYSKYDFKSKDPNFKNGFGEQILGNTWVGHYGKNHQQGTRIQILPKQKNHVILTGVKDGAFCHAGGYNGIADASFTVLTNSQPLVSMQRDAKPDAKKKPVPSTWTRHYTSEAGKKVRVFHSTQGASQDLLDPDYRRMMVNGIFWAAGDESKIKADNDISFVGKYQPSLFKFNGHVKGVKPEDLMDYSSPIMPKKATVAPEKKKPALKGYKHTAQPKKDPSLKRYEISKKHSPRPKLIKPMVTTLPVAMQEGDRVALIGGLQFETERQLGHIETLLHQQFPDKKIVLRNFAWPADTVTTRPRPANFGDLDQHLHYFKADLVLAAFGYSESFAGEQGLAKFEKDLSNYLTHLKSRAYNGKSAAKIVLVSPVADENIPHVAAADWNNDNITRYAAVMQKVAAKHQVGFIDALTPSLTEKPAQQRTRNGHALNAYGHEQFASTLVSAVTGKPAPEVNEDLRKLVVDKNSIFAQRYRPLNTFYYTGGRSKDYGYLDFLPAMRNFDIMAKNRDKAIHATAASGKIVKPDDSNLPKLDPVRLARGANKFMSPADELKSFKVDPRIEVNLFASEEQFPEIACPISIRWDAKGRLWVSTSKGYPHLYPGQAPADTLVILEDTDQDGKADKCTTFADDLHIPLSFVLDDKGGVYVSEQPHLSYLQDTDGDGKADRREIIYTGFGCEDSHHSLHDFIWTPGGELMFRESVFHHSQVETPYGPVRVRDSSWFLYNPATKKLTAFGSYFNTNPWGVTYDKWGNHIASHPVFASSFHATNPSYPAMHPKAPRTIQAYSGVCGHLFIDSPIWPKEMQGGMVKNRYKPTNNVEFLSWSEQADHFAEKKQSDLIFAENLSFIPVDIQMGPRGALYISDWYNPVKGHAQYSLRDPRRDRKAGRIWRVVPKGGKLEPAAKIDGASIVELLELLKSPRYDVRYRVKRALRARKHSEVAEALDSFIAANQDNEHALLEALWVSQGINVPKLDLLEKLVKSNNHLVAAAAMGPIRFWSDKLSAKEIASYLGYGAKHSSQHVRRETVITASYIGTPEAFTAIQPVLDSPAGPHLAYAIQTSFHSEALRPFWTNETAARLKKLGAKKEVVRDTRTAAERKFDASKRLISLTIRCVPERLQFDKKQLKVKAGMPVKLLVDNPDATQHNLLILAKDTPVQEIGMAANEMAKDPEAAKKHYIPSDKRVLFHTKLIDAHSQETLRFIAPKTPGKYPYVCTFPGHWTVMKGVLVVE